MGQLQGGRRHVEEEEEVKICFSGRSVMTGVSLCCPSSFMVSDATLALSVMVKLDTPGSDRPSAVSTLGDEMEKVFALWVVIRRGALSDASNASFLSESLSVISKANKNSVYADTTTEDSSFFAVTSSHSLTSPSIEACSGCCRRGT